MGRAVPQLLIALDAYHNIDFVPVIVISGDPTAAEAQALLRAAHSVYAPDKVIVHANASDTYKQYKTEGKATAHCCANHYVLLSTTDPTELTRWLEKRLYVNASA